MKSMSLDEIEKLMLLCKKHGVTRVHNGDVTLEMVPQVVGVDEKSLPQPIIDENEMLFYSAPPLEDLERTEQ